MEGRKLLLGKVGEPKHVLLLFSGGLDSLYVAEELLGAGCKVDLLPCDGPTHHLKKQMEKEARRKGLERLEKKFPDTLSCRTELAVSPSGIPMEGGDTLLTQPIWLVFAAVWALSDKHDWVVIPMLGDDGVGIATTEAMVRTFREFRDIRWMDCDAELVFPAITCEKSTILGWAPEELFDIFWTCEMPKGGMEEVRACLECGPCTNLASGMLAAWMSASNNKRSLIRKAAILEQRGMIPTYLNDLFFSQLPWDEPEDEDEEKEQ